ncbi:hypothetical protein T10_3713 [Trichinella papuae]|uniref:Uncharacterized protein n=1 Tax=Trichinella papuae TaxID=268474 RepID=A0A0V1M3X3_9BILA|nr:hypothetical protein T10_3713 [Trichinella papuae]
MLAKIYSWTQLMEHENMRDSLKPYLCEDCLPQARFQGIRLSKYDVYVPKIRHRLTVAARLGENFLPVKHHYSNTD